jgi:hypothetical protein
MEAIIRAQFSFADIRNSDEPTKQWLDYPATKETLRQLLERAGAVDERGRETERACYVEQYESPVSGLAESIPERASFNEVNYLAVKLAGLDEDELEIFEAVLESGRHYAANGSGDSELADMINITENLETFTFHSSMDEQGYGEYLLTGPDNVIDKLKSRLRYSSSEQDQEFAQYIEYLVECADAEQFGRSMSHDNDGEFVSGGYLIEDGGFGVLYHGEHDIPDQCRIWEDPSVSFIKVTDVNMFTLLLEMHALGGNYTQDAKHNLQALMSGDCFITVTAEKLTVFPAAEVLHLDSEANRGIHAACDADARVFFVGMIGGGYLGNIQELVTGEIKDGVRNMSYDAVQIDVDFKDGTNRVFSPVVWSGLPNSERDRVAGAIERFDPIDKQNAETYLNAFRRDGESLGNAVTAGDFLAGLNADFMARAQNRQPDMLRVARDAAQEMLAHGAEVYRLMPECAVKLSPLDAMKSRGLWYSEHREFAIKRDGLEGLEKWAERKAGDIERQIERGALGKSRGGAELE